MICKCITPDIEDGMIQLVRVDDRLLHGQTLYAWVPFIKADAVVIASDVLDSGVLRSAVKYADTGGELRVIVKKVDDVVKEVATKRLVNSRVMLVVSDLRDAMRLYKLRVMFDSLNIGNVHHMDGGRKVSPSVILNKEDEQIIEEFESLGVEIDIREIPASSSVSYRSGRVR